MRYRVDEYRIWAYNDTVIVAIKNLPSDITLEKQSGSDELTTASARNVTEAMRPVIDETAGEVFCSSMQKSKVKKCYGSGTYQSYSYAFYIEFDIPPGKTIDDPGQCSIEMDWGEAPSDLAKEATLNAVGQDAAAAKTAAQGITGYALQGTNSSATNTAIKSAVDALSPVAGAASAYNEGKPALAQAITDKGVETAATDSLATMADKVMQISQDSYTIDGGELYAKQLFGSLETPNYWNLYEVLMQLLSDGRLANYGGILLAEYYKGYDSLALAGAGAGGAYVVSDMENGVFKMYTQDTTHTWNTEDDGKGNRWVAYCFADEYHDFQITDTNTSPRSIFIGRKVGTITSLVAGRVSQIVVPDGNKLVWFNTGSYTQNWEKRVALRNMQNIQGTCVYNSAATENIYIKTQAVGENYVVSGCTQLKSCIFIVDGGVINLPANKHLFSQGHAYPLSYFYVECLTSIRGGITYQLDVEGTAIIKTKAILGLNADGLLRASKVKKLYLPILEEARMSLAAAYLLGGGNGDCGYLFIGYDENDRSKDVKLRGTSFTASTLTDIELKNGYKKNIDVSALTTVLTAENIALHMLDRLADNTGEETLELTIGATNFARIMADEIYAPYVAAAQAKNWRIV